LYKYLSSAVSGSGAAMLVWSAGTVPPAHEALVMVEAYVALVYTPGEVRLKLSAGGPEMGSDKYSSQRSRTVAFGTK
jgi:hypothetical protein